MNEMNEVWLQLAQDRMKAQLNAVAEKDIPPMRRAAVQRAWLTQQAGRALRTAGTRMITWGKRLECGEVSALQTKIA